MALFTDRESEAAAEVPLNARPAEERPSPVQEREDRIRRIVGGKRGRLPRVSAETLRRYYEFLHDNLRFPFTARYHAEAGAARGVHPVRVTGLIDPDRTDADASLGLLCQTRAANRATVPLADLEVDEGGLNALLVEDYWYWLWNWQ